MEFLNPGALYGLFALPLLLIPYFVRRRPRRYVFSSLYMFSGLGASPAARPFKRLRLPLLFFLQLILLALMILSLGEPVFSTRPSKVAIVLDNSASMQALEQDKPRFALAHEKAAGIFTELAAGAAVNLYLIAPRLERFTRESLAPSEASRAIAGLKPLDVGEAPIDYGDALARLAREQQYDRVYLLTDRPARGQGGAVRVISVGQPQANLAITSLTINPTSLSGNRMTAGAEVANFSDRDTEVKITLRGAGTPLATRSLMVRAGRQASATFEGVGSYPYYDAEISARDALALDNRRFAVASATRSMRILAISPRPQELASLRAIRGLTLDIVAPADYEKTDRSRYNLELFHFTAPAVLPRNPALFILPPENELVEMQQAGSEQAAITGWRDGDRITRYVNFALFRPRFARALSPRVPGESIVHSSAGPLVYAASQGGNHYLVLGFDPFPYLGQQNLPISIFTLNVFDWFFSFSGERGGATGEAIPVPDAREGDVVITPAGERFALRSGSTAFGNTFYQGLYQWVRGGEKTLSAINLRDIGESDLRHPTPIVLSSETEMGTGASVLLPFWPYFLLASLLLLVLEWFLKPRMEVSRSAARRPQAARAAT